MHWEWLLTKDPVPLERQPSQEECSLWPILRNEALDRNFPAPMRDYLDAVDCRKSTREFGDLDDSILSGILWYTLRTQALLDSCGKRLLRPVPSAGATHPIDLLVLQPDGMIWRYDGNTHSKQFIDVNSERVSSVYSNCREVLDPCNGNLLILVANLARVAQYYSNFESLVWRDAGVILGALSLTSEVFGVAYCPLGVTGDSWLYDLLSSKGKDVRGVGVALIGSR